MLTKQILAKSAAGDYQVEWIDAPSGGIERTEVLPYRSFHDASQGIPGTITTVRSGFEEWPFSSTTRLYRNQSYITLPSDYTQHDILELLIGTGTFAYSESLNPVVGDTAPTITESC